MKAHRFTGLLIVFSAILSAAAPETGSWKYWLEEPEMYSDTSSYGYRTSGSYSDGDLKRAFAPSLSRSLSGTTWGRTITSGGLEVTGIFRYTHRSEDERALIHDRMPYGPIPVLLADSSVTGTRMQRFELYSDLRKKFRKLETGLSVRYAVDDGWHTVFPKSENKHVDRILTASILFPSRNKSLGITVSGFSFQEILTTSPYQLDQDLSPVFLRISGLDYPVILRGSGSIERLKVHEGISASLDYSFGPGKISVYREISDGSAEDGGAYREPMGTWKAERSGAEFAVQPLPFLNIEVNAILTDLDAFHPNLDLNIFRFEQRVLAGSADWMMNSGASLKLDISSLAELSDDLFTGSRRYFHVLDAGLTYRGKLFRTGNHRLNISAGVAHREPLETIFQTVDNANWYFSDYIAYDRDYYNDPVNSFTLGPEWTVAGTAYTYSVQCSYSELRTAGYETTNRSVTLALSVSKSN